MESHEQNKPVYSFFWKKPQLFLGYSRNLGSNLMLYVQSDGCALHNMMYIL
jgi:hypothetical protein